MERIFLFEECTVNPLNAEKGFIQELAKEGLAMILALAEDFCRITDIDTCLFINTAHLPGVGLPQGCKLIPIQGEFDPGVFEKNLSAGDKVIIVAPECDNTLYERIGQAKKSGAEVLGSSLESVAITSNKLRTAEVLKKTGIPTPFTCLLADEKSYLKMPFPRVIKPIDGAGAANTFKVKDEESWNRISSFDALQKKDSFIVQPWIEGQSSSICLFVRKAEILPVISGFQLVDGKEQIEYRGGQSPLPENLYHRAYRLAGKVLSSISGLEYWVGVDLILGYGVDDKDDYVLEINPRLTTSYLGARIANPNRNLAKLWLGRLEVGIFGFTSEKIRFDKKGKHKLFK